ncbi:hypothetical protein GCM10010191_61640 [Actinomadura vinacea]|uniref:Uncharacterized protein n=1 Tax=Actinomadura vinacea TaxID=115336 RepID=A0ABN3JSJ6_9ACTN
MHDRAFQDGSPERRTTVTFDLDVLLTVLPAPGGDLPLVFLDDPRRTPAPEAGAGGEPVTALLAACLQTGLELVTDAHDLLVPPAPGWQVWLDRQGTLTVRGPRDPPARPFCRVERLGAPPGWAAAAFRLGHVVLFAGCIDIADDAMTPDVRLTSAAAGGLLAVGAIGYRPG